MSELDAPSQAGREGEAITYPGAAAPDREYSIDANGVRIAVHEWGDHAAPPIFFAHGGFDFARTYDVFAPMIAAAGFRVVSWDQRGHGDSEHAMLYSWDADVRDAIAVIESVTDEPRPALGHSKGAVLLIHLADAQPYRFSAIVNLDGIPHRRPIPDSELARKRMLSGDLSAWLDHRRGAASNARQPGTIDELARRRARMNPRLPLEWLRYLVTVGARCDPDGWRWKIDPSLRMGGFGPWRPEWTAMRLPGIGVPFMGVLGGASEPMGWGTKPEQVADRLPRGARCEYFADVGHFVHIERPEAVSSLVLDFLGAAQ